MIAAGPLIILLLTLLVVVGLVIVPGAALIAIPVALIGGVVAAVAGLRSAGSRGLSADASDPGERLPEPLEGPGAGRPEDSQRVAGDADRVTQG
jgi:hypothetical protein